MICNVDFFWVLGFLFVVVNRENKRLLFLGPDSVKHSVCSRLSGLSLLYSHRFSMNGYSDETKEDMYCFLFQIGLHNQGNTSFFMSQVILLRSNDAFVTSYICRVHHL